MFKKMLIVFAVSGLAVFQLTGCGKQTVGLNATSLGQTTEAAVESSTNDAIALSDVSNGQNLGVLNYDAVAPGSSCPEVTKTLVGINPTTFTIDIDFGNGCIPANYFRRVTTSGNITLTATLFTDKVTSKVTETTINAKKNIVKTWMIKPISLYVTGTTDIDRIRAGSGISRTISINEARHILNGAGRLVMNQQVDLNLTVADTGKLSGITQRVINGTGSVDHLLAKVLATATLKNLTLKQGYCHPVDGSISLVLTSDKDGSTIGTYTLTFIPDQPGVANFNGKQITLNPCSQF